MSIVTTSEKTIGFTMRDEIVRIEAYGKNCLRVRSTRNTYFSDEKWTLLDAEEVPVTISGDEREATIVNGDISAKITRA